MTSAPNADSAAGPSLVLSSASACNDVRHLNFAAEFAIPEVTYKVTGPVTVSYAVNGRTLGTIRCDHPGDFQVEKPVPKGWSNPTSSCT